MKYISTRGRAAPKSFKDVTLGGLAEDGGLYMPSHFPHFTMREWEEMAGMTYARLACEIIHPFTSGDIEKEELQKIADETYNTRNFRHKDIAPLHKLDDNTDVLELFHGPTLAFKDFALQFLGRLMEFFLARAGGNVIVIGATSGDTGSAAIEGCRHSPHITLFMMHPKGRVSEVQRRQMTTICASNIHNLALNTDFDGCQALTKEMFSKYDGMLQSTPLVAVNSINWVRILAQVVYYAYTALRLPPAKREKLRFIVPTGNFGDIFAGYVARKMGLPIDRLTIATNSNDILHRFLSDNDYSKKGVTPTLSPSMDIQISSNFERLLFDLHEQDDMATAQLMEGFKQMGKLSVSAQVLDSARRLFDSARADDATITHTIREIYAKYRYLICPHTATALHAANALPYDGHSVALATAHPAKFPDSVEDAASVRPALPPHLAGLLSREEHYTEMSADIDKISRYISSLTSIQIVQS